MKGARRCKANVRRGSAVSKRFRSAGSGLTPRRLSLILPGPRFPFAADQLNHPELTDPDLWCALSAPEQRERLGEALLEELGDAPGVEEVRVAVGPIDRPNDLVAVVRTDVGELRAPLWSHARAELFCDASVHPANRAPHAPAHALRDTAEMLRGRLEVRFALESRGLTFTLRPEPGVERIWTAERSRFRNRTAVTREDRVEKSAEVDVRDLLAHFYTGPALRMVADDGSAFLLPAATDAGQGRLVTLCPACERWSEGSHARCPHCGAAADTVMAARPTRR